METLIFLIITIIFIIGWILCLRFYSSPPVSNENNKSNTETITSNENQEVTTKYNIDISSEFSRVEKEYPVFDSTKIIITKYCQYKVKGKNPKTNRMKTNTVVVEQGTSDEIIMQKSGLLEPYTITPYIEAPPEPQISYTIKKKGDFIMDKYHTEYSATTKSLQALNNALAEIVSIGNLSDSDILSLRYWMDDNKHLSGNYPFDKIYSIIDNILEDGVIDSDEKEQLLRFLNDETICDSAPFQLETLSYQHICLTGTFTFSKRSEIEKLISQYGGFLDKGVTLNTDFLFVGGCVSSGWAYGNYGNKVKKAKELQQQGCHIHIFGEDILKNFLDSHTPPQTYSFQQCLDLFNDISDDELKCIQNHVDAALQGTPVVSRISKGFDQTLIDRGILWKYNDIDIDKISYLLSRNDLNKRIKSLNLELSFNKNMRLDLLVEWCKKNIPEHINTLFPDFTITELKESFLNTELLMQLRHYFYEKFPPEELF